ncbi:MAG: glycosyltransferase [Candidatus Curtissbacteria bacterium]|nr:glycosyltransferase [Candidatus Curtissbacteria bacterium]
MIDLTIHCVVKNEERWIWYALSSVKDIAKQIIIYDTGSSDKTVEIIRTIKSNKIKFEEKGEVDAAGLTKLRQEQLEKTKTEWFLLLDGDEIWPKVTISELATVIKRSKPHVWAGVIRAWNPVGDVYHYHPESIRYHWPFAPKNYVGWANLRLIRTKVPGLHVEGDYPLEAYKDKTKTPIQNYGKKHLVFFKNRYFHTTYLIRSSTRQVDKGVLNRAKKGKLEYGLKFSKDFKYPETFYEKRPSTVGDPWEKRSALENTLALAQFPLREARRRVLDLYNPKPR